jgi:hypothetical protein
VLSPNLQDYLKLLGQRRNMKVKQRTTCETCRKKKISVGTSLLKSPILQDTHQLWTPQCDGKHPGCTQCIFSKIVCPGYASEWTFVSQGFGKKDRRAVRSTRQPEQRRRVRETSTLVSRPLSTPFDNFVAVLVQSFVPKPNDRAVSVTDTTYPRVCGAWVEVLPELAVGSCSPVLRSAVNSLAITLLSGGPVRKVAVSSAWESYSFALGSLRDDLRSGSPFRSPSLTSEVAAAIMCLLLSELYLGTTMHSWTAHLEGFAQSVQLAGPELFASGIPHKIFVGARPLLVVLSFVTRKASFLNREEWKQVPFQDIPPSPLQELFSRALAIPPILDKLDEAKAAERDLAIAVAKDSVEGLVTVLDELDEWRSKFYDQEVNEPGFGSTSVDRPGPEPPSIWYKSITDCNSATHFWACRALCLVAIGELKTKYPEVTFDLESVATRVPGGNLLQETRRLAMWICQSAEYVLQDEMKMFGPGSVLLPVRVAHDIFLAGGAETEKQLGWCGSILQNAKSKGYEFVPMYFDRSQRP